MGSNSAELNLYLSSVFVPKTISEFLTELSATRDTSKKLAKLRNYVHVLEDELSKVDGFKRELPLCMLLLNDAIERLKEETMHCTETGFRPVMEEFIPLKANSGEDGGVKMSSDCSDKKNWMSSAQLWTTNFAYGNSDSERQGSTSNLKSRDKEEGGFASENPLELCKNRGGAFMPYKRKSGAEEDKEVLPVHDLSLSIPVLEMGLNLEGDSLELPLLKDEMKPQSNPPQQRKQRRSWSPELHRRFLSALQRLGGAQAATPKQIREIMQVDGLTNDEVKSHLQKYRLHVRKLPASSSAAPLNGSWLERGQCGSVSKAHYGSPEGPLHLAGSAKGASITGGNSMEEDEDEKSEIRSWKMSASQAC